MLGTDGTQVRIGIRAPREVSVLRSELAEQIQHENKRTAAIDVGAALGQIRGAGLPAPRREPGGERT